MHAPPDDEFARESARAVEILLTELPELAPIVAELSELFGEPPPAQIVFSELASITGRIFGRDLDDDDEERLERIFAAIEAVAGADGVDTTETVAFSFLDGLDPGALECAESYLGPATAEIFSDLLDGLLQLE